MSKRTSRLRFNKYKSSPQIGKLGDYSIKVGSGKTPKGGSSVYQNDGVILIRSQNVLDGQLELNEVAFISHEINKTMSNSEVNPNDVLLNITGASIGRCAIVPNDFPPANVNQHVCIIRADENKLDPKYLMQQILSPRIQNQINSLQAGGNREGLNFQQIRAFDVVIHDYQEQVQIGNFLSTIDSRITNQSSKIDCLQELKKGIMQKIFSQEIRFKREDGGEYPEWESLYLSELVTRRFKGELPRPKEDGNVLLNNEYLENNSTPLRVSNNVNVAHEDVLILWDGSQAGKAYTGFTGVLGSTLVGITLNHSRTDNRFIYFYLGHNLEIIQRSWRTGSGVPHVTKEFIEQFEVPVPSVEEQQKIADFLSTLDSKISLESQILETLQTLKKGLLQQMFV